MLWRSLRRRDVEVVATSGLSGCELEQNTRRWVTSECGDCYGGWGDSAWQRSRGWKGRPSGPLLCRGLEEVAGAGGVCGLGGALGGV